MAQFRRHGHEIDIVVLDLTMPRMGGDEVFRRIRASHPGTRIILCSGYTQEDISRQFEGLGLSAFIEKPFTPSELIEKIGVVLAESPPEKEPHAARSYRRAYSELSLSTFLPRNPVSTP